MDKPKKEFRAGRVRATIWENEIEKDGQIRQMDSVRVEGTYRDGEGNWHASSSFLRGDLPKLELVVRKAYEYLALRERDPAEEESLGA